jgi:predicted nucleic acid-binding protein
MFTNLISDLAKSAASKVTALPKDISNEFRSNRNIRIESVRRDNEEVAWALFEDQQERLDNAEIW